MKMPEYGSQVYSDLLVAGAGQTGPIAAWR
jgi:hypothetical protein